jgi:cytochrome P450
MRRNIPPTGGVVAGEVLPGGTVVSVPPWATYRAKRNFRDPERFMPKRWLINSECGSRDNKAALNPSSLGPRNCPGQNLAWLEPRLVLAKISWVFEVSVPPGTSLPLWGKQGIWCFWDKHPTIIRLGHRA